MVTGFWGRKIGMTQAFDKDKAIPVTAIDLSSWVIVGEKTKDRDGYRAVQVAQVKDRYKDEVFDRGWLKKPKRYFSAVREIRLDEDSKDPFIIGKPVDFYSNLKTGDQVDASGLTIGRGFAGVVKRHGFSGGPASHGGKLGRHPGGISFMASQGRVIKGKKLPGHFGQERKMIRNLDVVKVDGDRALLLVKGSVPGKSGSLLFLRKV